MKHLAYAWELKKKVTKTSLTWTILQWVHKYSKEQEIIFKGGYLWFSRDIEIWAETWRQCEKGIYIYMMEKIAKRKVKMIISPESN